MTFCDSLQYWLLKKSKYVGQQSIVSGWVCLGLKVNCTILMLYKLNKDCLVAVVGYTGNPLDMWCLDWSGYYQVHQALFYQSRTVKCPGPTCKSLIHDIHTTLIPYRLHVFAADRDWQKLSDKSLDTISCLYVK